MSLYSVKVSLKLRAGVAQRPIFAIGMDNIYIRMYNNKKDLGETICGR